MKVNNLTQPARQVTLFEAAALGDLADRCSQLLTQDTVCVIVASTWQTRQLKAALRQRGIDVAAAIRSRQLISVDSSEIVSIMQVQSQPSPNPYKRALENISQLFAGSGRPVQMLGAAPKK